MSKFINTNIQKPLRYIGHEIHATYKKDAPASILLAFPDVYEIGMSHHGSRILYERVNYLSSHSMERVYMPWKDAISQIRSKGLKLLSLESGREFREFSAVGFSMQNELCYTNVLAMLELGGLEIFSDKRKEDDPIVIAGGGATYNPTPMKKFIDVFVIGEADKLIIDILNILAEDLSKKEKLLKLSSLRGVYVPLFHSNSIKIEKQVLADLNDSPIIQNILIPYMELVHDRITYEIQRGCARGCRFCQAGMIYRPVRQRDPLQIVNSIERDIFNTGYRDIGFLSLNACDYSPLLKLISSIYDKFKGMGMFVSLPSLRIESISNEFLDILSKLPKSGFTIAPEAGSKRIRKLINKDMSDDEIFNTVSTVSELNWDSIKSYFMIGLPTETMEDVEAIASLAHEAVKHIKNKRCRLSVSISNFVPKPHTPFQWEAQLDWEAFNERIHKLQTLIRGKNLSMKWSDAKMSEVEGILCRGDENVSDLIYSVYSKGEIFSSWGSEMDYEKWTSSMKELGLDKDKYLSARPIDKKLPWSNISSLVDEKWLIDEREKAYGLSNTPDCSYGVCSSCGVCSGTLKNIIEKNVKDVDISVTMIKPNPVDKDKFRLRAIMKKEGQLKWMGHFEFMDAIEKAFIRASIPVLFSKGFKPVSQVSYAPPVGIGVESNVEPVDLYLSNKIEEDVFIKRMNAELPEQMHISKAWYIPVGAPSLYQDIKSVLWRIDVLGKQKQELCILEPDEWQNKVVEVERKGGIRRIRLGDVLLSMDVENRSYGTELVFRLKMDNGKTIKPYEVLSAVTKGLNKEDLNIFRIGMDINGVDFNNQ